jgi:hypothetical protein
VQKKSSKTAFSIIELSIVALIIAALIGGVLTANRISQNSKLVAARTLTKSSPVVDIGDLVVWYETTMPQSFDNLSADDGKTVATWYDLSPNKNNAIAIASPTYTGNILNGLPILRFNGSTNYFTFNGTFLASNNYTVIAVEQRSSNKSTNYFVSGNGLSSANQKPHFGYRDDTTVTFAQYSNDFDAIVPAYVAPIPRIFVYRFSSATGKKLDINGVNFIDQSTASAKTGLIAYDNAQIGRYHSTSYYQGDIAEIIIFNKSITDNEKKDVEQYLSKKWGITLS